MLAVLALTVTAIRTSYGILQRRVPDFSSMNAGEERKSAFIDYLLPRVRERNREIMATRRDLLALRQAYRNQDSLSARRLDHVQRIASRYDLDMFDPARAGDWRTLLRRVDIVPPSLALAQAASESAWGTSRFAAQGRNFFGQWCYDPGCGIVPRERPEGASYEVADFASAQQAVNRYMYNLNHHPAYEQLRRKRAELRRQDADLSGLVLAEGLEKYSQRRGKYVDMIKDIISYNDLEALDPSS